MMGMLHMAKLDDCMGPCWAGMLHIVKFIYRLQGGMLQMTSPACCVVPLKACMVAYCTLLCLHAAHCKVEWLPG